MAWRTAERQLDASHTPSAGRGFSGRLDPLNGGAQITMRVLSEFAGFETRGKKGRGHDQDV